MFHFSNFLVLRIVVSAAVLTIGAVSPSWAQPVDLTGTRPTIAVPRIDVSQAPTIDGDPSDAVWANAAIIDDFGQLEPVPGAAVSERTVVRIMYDENNF